MRKILSSFSFFILLAVAAVAQQPTARFREIQESFRNTNNSIVMIAAHRGAHLEDPENSLAAFRKSIEMGIDIIELDVRCTKDGVLICMHDKTVDRTTNGKGNVKDLTFGEIRKLKLKHNNQLTEEIVPTLEEALSLTKGKIMVDLDIKSAGCIDAIMDMVNKTNTADQCLFFVGEAEHAKMIKAKNPAFITLLRTNSAQEVTDAFKVVKSEAIHIDDSHNNKEVIKGIKANGARVWHNALGDVDNAVKAGNTAAFERALNTGANIIQTDYPALLKQFLTEKKMYY
ncbi:glycerophosphodiester phosphodiesterase family protein [Pseudobacter ginsenosidimutans]|uniref:Glycerophosphoryl diester phosphodiesterase n=1 Tax=Pseudobacter ginsenosidimutans TaxID=661488 RepID=A0A4Q7MS69_9BACT|nr:glycerophosphodiester phosphodiesterase family protein [Pseudobacter ginsenosidimutans]QEC42441.1 glycerophosphodiester phosphodiesterase family protein [Pseudobacter ginsenosidimutans]RZS70709.1 glycerophosphoryl diester phosphodiesterase [Pseudobacter ginsenosidimutans]